MTPRLASWLRAKSTRTSAARSTVAIVWLPTGRIGDRPSAQPYDCCALRWLRLRSGSVHARRVLPRLRPDGYCSTKCDSVPLLCSTRSSERPPVLLCGKAIPSTEQRNGRWDSAAAGGRDGDRRCHPVRRPAGCHASSATSAPRCSRSSTRPRATRPARTAPARTASACGGRCSGATSSTLARRPVRRVPAPTCSSGWLPLPTCSSRTSGRARSSAGGWGPSSCTQSTRGW